MTGTRQIASQVLLIRPQAFGPNRETAASNPFQRRSLVDEGAIQTAALTEFGRLEVALQAAGVKTIVVEDTLLPKKPDAIFPNNWVSFHADGTVVLYPMATAARRLERRPEVITQLANVHGLAVGRVIDLSSLEQQGLYLEGTGSLVLDRHQRIAYAARSSRTHPIALAEFARRCGYETHIFDSRDQRGVPVYHTNILMSLGESFAVVCVDALPDHRERQRLLDSLHNARDLVIEISVPQMQAFAGNILELGAAGGVHVVAMSATARAAFTPEQLKALSDRAVILSVPIEFIERIGGGSVRCMVAELFLPASDMRPQ